MALKRADKLRNATAWTVRELVADFKQRKLTTQLLAEGTIRYCCWDLDKVILPKLSAMQVRTVTPADIVHMIESAH
ncbi:hypothetical protein [Noviherbaspirillum denitrificans]|uniref:hypothetical protein n=1 Tax=Noviherbaspirillum denitrificans TaxID=1968433 RepID=UPI001F212597|nr:hypothetical protein [Noviherbaspirillum denitrificans]